VGKVASAASLATISKVRNDNLDIVWLKDTSNDPEDEMTEPEDIAAAIAGHLRGALEEIDTLTEELAPIPTEEAA
jgi:type I restriction enzyme M protein